MAWAVRARDLPTEVWIVCGLTVLAAAIRIVVINNQSFWWDEALTAYEAQLPFGAMIHTVLHVETTPPLYFVLIWAWGHLFGTSEIALRSLSTLAGIALVPIAYLCAREAFSRRAGVVAAAFVALNPFMIWFSQEARAYTLLAALSGASFLWFLRARHDPSPRSLVCWAIFSSLAVMTHFFAGFVVAPEALWLLWTARTRRVAGAVAAVALVQVAMVPFARSDTTHGVGWIAAIPRTHRIAQLFSEWGSSMLWRRVTPAVALVAGAAFVAIVAWLIRRGGVQTRAGARVTGVVVGFAILVPLALAFAGQDYFLSRNLMPAFIPAMALVAGACVVPRARIVGSALAAVLLVMFAISTVIVQTQSTLQRPDWRAVARLIGPAETSRAILYAGGSYADPLKIYIPHVNWVQPPTREVRIQEIDLVGAPWWLPPIRELGRSYLGRSIGYGTAIDRIAVRPPELISIQGLVKRAPRLFRKMPKALLFFFQQPGP